MPAKILPQRRTFPFDAHRADVYSQGGEDGVIKYLLGLAGIDGGYFLEFGAWDGKHLSNCAWLAEKGWDGCFIEGDPGRFKDLQNNYGEAQNIAALNAYVTSTGQNTVDRLLDRVAAPKEITVLSIDIDGNDYHVWRSMVQHSAMLCVIEFNPTIPAQVSFIQEDLPELNFGNSLAALWELGVEKGYGLVATTNWNAFFMPNTICEKWAIPTYSPAEIKYTEYEAAMFHGYNGQMEVVGYTELVWHGIPFNGQQFEILPESLQRLPTGRDPMYYQALEAFKATYKKIP